jgi:hypothetical protein
MRRPVLVLACLAAAATGCGGSDDPRAGQRAAPPVELEISAPDDLTVVRAERIEVRGTVVPASAAVLVGGQRAAVTGGGTFTASVALEPGMNVVDVMASAGGHGPAMTAFRVTRELPVTVPDLGGKTVAEVQDRLGGLGLRAQIEHGGGLIEELLPGEPAVCDQDPAAGAQVRRGARIRVVVSKSC